MNMTVENGIGGSSLSLLTNESRNLLSSLLNTKKILPCDCPDRIKRHRDWRGVASLANISTEIAASIKEYNDKTGRVLDLWIQRNDGTATVARLLEILQWIDRFDVYDDLLEIARNNQLLVRPVNTIQVNGAPVSETNEEDLITFEDKQLGSPQRYHAYVLYAMEDVEFVRLLLTRMRDKGFRMCTEDNLLPGHSTRFAAVARLMSERCRYIILVCSPDFVRSPANRFFTNLAQADGIQKRELKTIPLQYRPCELPPNIRHYHSLRYFHSEDTPVLFDFWTKLEQSLDNFDLPRLTNTSSSRHSAVDIAEMSSQSTNGFTPNPKQNCLALPSIPREATGSMTDLHSLPIKQTYEKTHSHTHDTKSLSSTSSEKKKKSGPISKMLNVFRGKKQKEAIVVAN